MISRRGFFGTIAALFALPETLVEWPAAASVVAPPLMVVHGRYWEWRTIDLLQQVRSPMPSTGVTKFVLNTYLDQNDPSWLAFPVASNALKIQY